MKIEEYTFRMHNGKTVRMRSPRPEDAEKMIAYLKQTAGETEFMIRYPEEVTFTVEGEEQLLGEWELSPKQFMINAVADGKVVGNVGVSMIGDRIKLRHRAGFGIAIIRDYWHQGIGRELMTKALELATQVGYRQAELGVYAENEKAIALYHDLGFKEVGRMPNAFYCKDGHYIDELMMVKPLQ